MEHFGGPRITPILPEDGPLLAPDRPSRHPNHCNHGPVADSVRPFAEDFLLNSVAPHPLEILKAAEGAASSAEDVHTSGWPGAHVTSVRGDMERGWKRRCPPNTK